MEEAQRNKDGPHLPQAGPQGRYARAGHRLRLGRPGPLYGAEYGVRVTGLPFPRRRWSTRPPTARGPGRGMAAGRLSFPHGTTTGSFRGHVRACGLQKLRRVHAYGTPSARVRRAVLLPSPLRWTPGSASTSLPTASTASARPSPAPLHHGGLAQPGGPTMTKNAHGLGPQLHGRTRGRGLPLF